MIYYKEGNALNENVNVLGYQTNCLGVMGAGIAKQIKEAYPNVYADYKQLCNKVEPKSLLGTTQLVSFTVAEDKYHYHMRYIANIFGELSYIESVTPCKHGEKPRHTDYNALKRALVSLSNRMHLMNLTSLALPDHIGCGLAGGDWEGVVLLMIKEIFGKDQKIEVYIVKYVK